VTKFTIVTPSFNAAAHIQTCVESVRNQNYPNVEHIVQDNLSTDGTVEILSTLQMDGNDRAELRIFVEPDHGQSDAINKGFLRATGDIVCWLNCDEFYLPGVLAQVAKVFEERPATDVVFGDVIFVGGGLGEGRRRIGFPFNETMLIQYGCYIPSCATFLRRNIVSDGYLLDETYKVTMDFEYYVRLSKKGYKFKYLPIPIAKFTWHDSNVSLVNKERRVFERERVQLEYGGFQCLGGARIWLFRLLKFYWISRRLLVRVLRRAKSSITDAAPSVRSLGQGHG